MNEEQVVQFMSLHLHVPDRLMGKLQDCCLLCRHVKCSLADTSHEQFVFTGLFGIEMVLKLFALGFFEYIADRFNCFDGVVVILSVLEILLDVRLLQCLACSACCS